MTVTDTFTPARATSRHSYGRGLGIWLAVVVLIVAGAQLPIYRVTQLAAVMIFAMAIIGLNLVMGYGGMLSIGHSALFGVGGYTTAVLIVEARLTPVSTIPLALLLGAVAGTIMGLPASRVKGIYLALVTLAFGVAFPEIVNRMDAITGGSGGLIILASDLAPPAWSGFAPFERTLWLYYLSAVLLIVVFILSRNLVTSRRGLSIRALRDHEVAAVACGVSASKDRVILFAISGAITAVAGSLFAMSLGALSPESSFTVFTGIQLLTGLIIGGVATTLGPLIGGVAIVFIPAVATELTNGQAYGLVFGVVLIVVVLVLPDGVAGWFLTRRERRRTARSSRRTPDE